MFLSHGEIFGQQVSLAQTLDHLMINQAKIKRLPLDDVDEIVFLACGSSYWLSLSASLTYARLLGKPARAIKSSDVLLHPELHQRFGRLLLVTPTRSGTTQETIDAIRYFQKHFTCYTLAFVEYEHAPIMDIADMVFSLPWACEQSVCQTASFSNLYLATIAVAALLADDQAFLNGIRRFVSELPALVPQIEAAAAEVVDRVDYRYVVTLGSGAAYGISIEGAYIGIEMAQQPANYYTTLELRHGPIVMLDQSSLVCLFSTVQGSEYEEKMCAEAKSKGATVVAVGGSKPYDAADRSLMTGATSLAELQALLGVIFMQGLAYFKAVRKGVDPDNPGDLCRYIML